MLVLVLESSTSSAKTILHDSKKGILCEKGSTYPREICEEGMTDTEAVYCTLGGRGMRVSGGLNGVCQHP